MLEEQKETVGCDLRRVEAELERIVEGGANSIESLGDNISRDIARYAAERVIASVAKMMLTLTASRDLQTALTLASSFEDQLHRDIQK